MIHLCSKIYNIPNIIHSNTWSLSHIFRQGNAVANALARRAKLSFPFAIWLDSVPLDLIPFVNADLLPS